MLMVVATTVVVRVTVEVVKMVVLMNTLVLRKSVKVLGMTTVVREVDVTVLVENTGDVVMRVDVMERVVYEVIEKVRVVVLVTVVTSTHTSPALMVPSKIAEASKRNKISLI